MAGPDILVTCQLAVDGKFEPRYPILSVGSVITAEAVEPFNGIQAVVFGMVAAGAGKLSYIKVECTIRFAQAPVGSDGCRKRIGNLNSPVIQPDIGVIVIEGVRVPTPLRL